jgi:enterochelin esterase-like enzyme
MSHAGPVFMTTLHGAASGVTMKVWVWLPPQYTQPAYAHTAFPALMLYPGGNGADHNLWAGTRMGGIEIDAHGARAGKLTPFVFVMPAMQLREDLDTECADLPGQPKIGTFLAVDVRHMIERNFRVQHDRTGWGAMGVSAGAYCANRLVYTHPDSYAALVSMDGYFTIETTLPAGNDPTVRAGDPMAVATRTAPPLSVLLFAGAQGPDLTTARQFLAHVRPPTNAQLIIQPDGRHLTNDIVKMVPAAFAYLTAHLARPTPITKGASTNIPSG